MHKADLAKLHPGDWLDYRLKQLTPGGLVDAGIATAQVVGTTDESALIKSERHPLLILAVQAREIVAAYRFEEGRVRSLFVEKKREP